MSGNMEMEPNPVVMLNVNDVDGAEGSSAPASLLQPALYSANNASQTEIKVENLVHNWTVKNFSHCYQEYLENFVHLNKAEETLTWSVKIYPKGNGENNKDFVFLCLNRVINSNSASAAQQPPLQAPTLPVVTAGGSAAGQGGVTSAHKLFTSGKIGFRSRFTLRNGDGKEIEMRVHPNPSHSDYVSYIKRDVLFPQILPQDMIVVTVEIDVAVETITVCQADQIQVPNTDAQLITDYGRLLDNDDLLALADFTVRAGGKEFRVHRAILASRSQVFMAMLSHAGTDEMKTGQMEITDLDADVVAEMLRFIYTGRCERGLKELAADLLIAADKYSLQDLKTHCERELINALCVENACQLLVLSDIHSAPRLRRKAVDHILMHSREVTATSGWTQMLQNHAMLVTEIVQNFNKVGSDSGPLASSSTTTNSPSAPKNWRRT